MKNSYTSTTSARLQKGDLDTHQQIQDARLSNSLKPNGECRKLYFKSRFAVFIPYDIIQWSFNGGGIPFDMRMWSLFSSACWTAKTGKFTCNFWHSTLVGYFCNKDKEFMRTAQLIGKSLKRLRDAKHISYKFLENRKFPEPYEKINDRHVEIKLRHRFDQKLRKVVWDKDDTTEISVEESIKKEQRDALERGKDCAKGSDLRVIPNEDPFIH